MFLNEIGNFYIRIEGRFESSHYLYNYFPDGSDEPNHGHSWKVEVYLTGKNGLREDGISYDFLAAKKKLAELVETMDHVLINDLPDFQGKVNPTSENIAKWFYHNLKEEVSNTGGVIKRVVIHEGPENLAYYEPA
jgi:6-pyruvoyltetrahydropterin/6-carboxytetrahydropterin synthase